MHNIHANNNKTTILHNTLEYVCGPSPHLLVLTFIDMCTAVHFKYQGWKQTTTSMLLILVFAHEHNKL